MSEVTLEKKKQKKAERKSLKRKKNNALVICQNGNQYWTTQSQFWQWVRERVIIKEGDYPLRGKFLDPSYERMVVIGNTVLNLSCPNHLREVLHTRRFRTF